MDMEIKRLGQVQKDQSQTLSRNLLGIKNLFLLVGIGLEEGMEVAHGQLVAPDDAHVGDALPVLVQLRHGGDDVVQVLLVQAAAVDGEADHIGKLGLLLGGLQVVLHREVAQLADADAVPADQLQGEAGARKGGMIPFPS